MEILELKNGSVDINNIDTYNELKKVAMKTKTT